MEPTTQVSVGGFPQSMKAKELAQYLEARVGVVWRCRVKTSCNPPNALPVFTCTNREEDGWPQGIKCPPHAFVHFATAEVVEEACKLAEGEKLMIENHVLTIRSSSESHGPIQRKPLKLSNVTVELGSLVSLNELLVSWKGPPTGVIFEVNPVKQRCEIHLTQWTLFSLSDTQDKIWMRCNYKMEFLVRDIYDVRKENEWAGDGELTMIVQFRSPPWVFYRTADDDIYHDTSFLLADDEDPWIRTLDFTPDKSIGRCHTYRISVSPRQAGKFQDILKYFDEQNLLGTAEPSKVRLPYEVKSTCQRSAFFLLPNERGIPFEIMFLVNSLVHKGIFKAASLGPGFYNVLRPSVTDTPVAVFALNHIFSYRNPVFDAEKRLRQVIDWVVSNKVAIAKKERKDGNMEVRRFIITPTKAYCCPSEVEISNRVLRKYSMHADRFLRVSFLEENLHSISPGMLNVTVAPIVRDIWPMAPASKTALFNRVRSILHKGFNLCGRDYSFLAFSTNQLRDHSAWFFAGNEDVQVDKIRAWMGSFPRSNIAKYAARMGQCFSSTFQTLKIPHDKLIPLDDIKRNNFNFSDGIGKIAPELAMEAAKLLNLDHNPPSAYQIRYAGFKGVVVTWPAEAGCECLLSLRDSMKKFISNHDILEVVSWTKFLPCFLNRQIVTLLSTLQVQNKVFIELQDTMVNKLNQVLDSAEVAVEVLTMSCSGDMHNTALEMLSAGFHPLCEPHLKGMLQSIRASQLEELLTKARIFVKDGRWLLGCMDELGVLEYGECFLRVSSPFHESYVPGPFTRLRSMKQESKVITGKVIMAKNPCLHPGDIRILQAVDKPALHHLVDCFVMPQKGHRPHSNEASGSDLDGDLYFVCWDPCLIPPGGESSEPMQYEAADTTDLGRAVRTGDLVEFFVKHMVNDNLGKICNAHVVHADLSELGALDPNCLRLAELAATAVDSPKTGKVVIMPQHLKPNAYPDFMCKEDKKSYHSKKILGILFRRVLGTAGREAAENRRQQELQISDNFSEQFYDRDLEVEGFEDYVTEAWHHKQTYDQRLNSLMDQFDVEVESDVVTGHFTTLLLKHNSRRRGDLKDRVRWSYLALKKEYREIFEGTSTTEMPELEEDCLQQKLESKASAWYHVTYHPDWVRKAKETNLQGSSKVHLLSFPWIAVEVLSRIKVRMMTAYESYHRLIQSLGTSLDIR